MNLDPNDEDDVVIDDDANEDGEPDANVNDQQDAEEEEIGFGDEEEDDDSAPDLPKRLRAEIKDRDRKLAAANKRIAELDKPAPKTDPGPRPTRDEFDWDDDAYDKAIDEWNEKRLTAEAEGSAPNELQAEAKQDVERLTTGIATLPYADAQELVPETMKAISAEDQFIIASAAKEPGKLIYALAKNPSRLSALMDIKNPVKKIAEIARMEMQMTTKSRRSPPPPEKTRTGDASASVSTDKEEKRLEEEARKTGNRTALIRYRQKKQAA